MIWAGTSLALSLLVLVVVIVTLFPQRAPKWAVLTAFVSCIGTVGIALFMLGVVSWEALG